MCSAFSIPFSMCIYLQTFQCRSIQSSISDQFDLIVFRIICMNVTLLSVYEIEGQSHEKLWSGSIVDSYDLSPY